MRDTKKPTIADVAELAGVSKSTVSRVLNDRTHYMREDTQARVLQVVAELGYRPSSVARSLVSKRTHTIGLLISDVGNPFYPEVIHGVEEIALKHDYDVFLGNTGYDLDRGMALVRSLADKSVDGAILMSSTMSDELVLELAQQQIPVVVLDWQLTVLDGVIGTIAVDFETGIRAAARHLVELGHRNLAHVSGPLNLRTSHARRDAFLAGVAESGVDSDTIRVVEGNFHIDGGRRALKELLDAPQPPTAVFAANDLMALGILWGARENGLRVPEDLSIIGFDDIELATEVSPPLSSVALPRFEIGTTAMGMLLDLISSGKEPQLEALRHQQIGSNLVIRQSTARVANPQRTLSEERSKGVAREADYQ